MNSNSFIPSLFNALSEAEIFIPQPNTWVRLRDPLSSYSFEEALLLCEEANGHWQAWVPDFGKTVLQRHQFTALG
jgi:hypothetical protein